MFYFGLPFVTYLMFKSKQAFEVTFVQQLGISAYAFVLFIPSSLLIFLFQQYSRFKYLMLLVVWIMHLFYLYKELYELRKKYFDFQSNK